MMTLGGGLWGVHEGGALSNEISALRRRDMREFPSCLCPPPWEDPRRRRTSATQKTLTKTWPCWHSDLRLLASRTARNKFLLLISHPIYGILLQQPELTSIQVMRRILRFIPSLMGRLRAAQISSSLRHTFYFKPNPRHRPKHLNIVFSNN